MRFLPSPVQESAMKKSIGDNMIPKDWTFERGLELVKKTGYNGIELARRSPVVSDEHYRRTGLRVAPVPRQNSGTVLRPGIHPLTMLRSFAVSW